MGATKAELRKDIEAMIWGQTDYRPGESDLQDQHVKETTQSLLQKIDTYCLGVIGKDHPIVYEDEDLEDEIAGFPKPYQEHERLENNYKRAQNDLRAEQRASVDRGGKDD